ncbi:hypothetical protein BDN67DRAFT_536608 [Paxillus ammoniavirescens]|nr:hypothetical protein BDN67DRAFT_536608 [Paxillus ammoniavirescens]
MRPSGESPSAETYPSETPVDDSRVHNQRESIEMVAIRETSTLSAHASPQPTPSTGPSSSTTVTSYQLSTSTANPATAPLIVTSPEERALVEEYRRLKDQSRVAKMVAEPLGSPAHDRDSHVHRDSPTSPSQSPGPVTPCTSSMASPISSHACSHIRVQPSQPLGGLDPLLGVVPSLLSPSPLSAPLRHSLHPRPTATVQSLGLHLMAPSDNPRAEAPSESATRLALRGAASDEEVD